MKKLSKVLVLVLSAIMVLAMSASVFAAEITVENAYEGETYNAYKLLEYTSDKTVTPAAYSYYLTNADYNGDLGTALKAAGIEFTQSADKTKWYVSNADELEGKGADIAKALYATIDDWKAAALAKSEDNVADADGKVTMEDLPQGYWFVTSSLGSLCTLQSYNDEALVIEKNELIGQPEKTASDTEFQVGDKVTYTITYTDVDGTNNDLVLTDTMSAGLTYKASTLKVEINGTETTTGWSATPTTDAAGATLVITVDATTMDTLKKGEKIVVTYDAVVNNDASLDGTEKNTVVARTSQQETTPKTVEIESFDVTINKTDGTNALKGAKFEIYRDDAECSGDALTLRLLTDEELEAAEIEKAADTVYYQVDTSATNTTIDMTNASSAVVYGLDKDSTYYVLETEAPEGYNPKEEPTPVEGGAASVDVINQAGSILPSTGGIGTTIFYVLGSLLVVGCGIVLVSRKRMQNNK